MSAAYFEQSRDRIVDLWIDAQACVLSLEQRIERNERNASLLQWLTFGFGLLTAGAGADLMAEIVKPFGANGQLGLSVLAVITGGLAGAAPLLAFDTKIKNDTKARQEFFDMQGELVDVIYDLRHRVPTSSDDTNISILESKLTRMDAYNGSPMRDAAAKVAENKAFATDTWIGPGLDAVPDMTEQGRADDLQPLTRG